MSILGGVYDMNIHTTFPKHPALQDLVRSFMLMGVHQSSFAPFAKSIIPVYNSTGLNFPLFGYHFTIDAASGATNLAHRASIHGQLSSAIEGGLVLDDVAQGWFASFNVIFSPLGLHHFLHRHVGALREIQDSVYVAEQHLSGVEFLREQLQEIFYYASVNILQHLQHSPSTPVWLPPAVFRTMTQHAEEFFLRKLFAAESKHIPLHLARSREQARYICQRLSARHGKASIHSIAKELSLSERQILNVMNTVVGTSGATFGNIQRFMHTSQLLRAIAATTPSAAEIDAKGISKSLSEKMHTAIFEAGYYDQSHCIRDFQRYAGTTPLALLQRQYQDLVFEKLVVEFPQDDEKQ
jgi:AraC-like DNA-binding protein